VVALHSGGLFFQHGYLAVDFFFIVSGFFLANTVLTSDINIFSWIKHKAVKIYPLYLGSIIVILCGEFIIGCLNDTGILTFVKQNIDVVYEIFFLQRAGFTMYNINFPDWYISSMLFTGFILFYFFSTYRESLLPMLFIIVITSLSYLINRSGYINQHSAIVFGLVDVGNIRALAGMSAGITLHSCIQNSKNVQSRILANVIEIIALLFIVLIIFLPNQEFQKTDILCYPLFSVVVFSCFKCRGIVSKFLENKILSFLSKYGLSLYLTHGLVIRYGKIIFENHWNITTFLILIFTFSIVFHHVIYEGIWIMKKYVGGIMVCRASARGAS
jgi:peptidoglycan/LPS O-acetylase OafA/YrhL